MTQDNTELLPVTQEDIAIALEHLGYDSVDDLHYWAENDTELRRFDELCSRFARHRLNTRPTQGHDALVEAVTHRFLQWELPTDFNPDAGISFEPEYNAEYMAKLGKPPMRHQPVGTNLLCYDQAKAMVEHICAPILTNTPSPQAEGRPIILQIADASDEHRMWERRWNALMAMQYHDTRFADSEGRWVLSDFIEYAGRACGFARTASHASPPQAEAAPDDGLVAELRAELEAIQGPKKGDDEHPTWLSTLLNVCRDIEDEGDRVYFGSTNDADDLRDVVEALEQAHHPLHLFRRPDLHRHNGELRKLNETQAARIAELADENTALRARPSGDGGWQPIETAPKDGRSILCYAPGAKIPAQMQWVVFEGEGRWADDPETFCEDSHWREYWTSVRYEPTHWQPLPEPPALSTIKGEG